jgi:hypothetical protein
MARLPSERFLIQQIGGEVILFEDYTEREIVRFDPGDMNATGQAQQVIDASELSLEDKCFAHLWSGYFYAHAGMPDPETDLRDRAPNGGALADGIPPDASLFHGGEQIRMDGFGPRNMFQMQWSGELVTVVVDSLEPAGGGKVNFLGHVITEQESAAMMDEAEACRYC